MKIASLNCRGLRDTKKRKDVFKFLREKKASIYCLQDTHLVKSDDNIIHAEWGLENILTPGTRDSRGVMNLFNNTFEYDIGRVVKDDDGNLLVSSMNLCKKLSITLINLYGPNRDSPDFYNKIENIINDMNNEFVIICGDYNLVQDFYKDCYNYTEQNNKKSANVVEKLKNNFGLVDPWRVYNPNKLSYTWQRKNPIKQARLDFFLISSELMTFVRNVNILPGYRTDHSYIELELQLSTFKKGKGFWRFNNSLLKDPVYVNKVKECILETKREYSPIPVNPNMIEIIPNDTLQLSIEDDLFLETLLMNIRGVTISYSSWKKKERNNLKTDIEKQIKLKQEEFDNDHSEQLSEQLTDLNTQLEDIRKYELEGLLLRTRSRWIEHGEKPTKYFCNLEKRNYVNKTITKVINDNGTEIINQEDILNEVKQFYQNLYNCRDHLIEDVNLNNIFKDYDIPRLSEDEKNMLDNCLTKSEVLDALKRCKNEKTPGSDGFTAEFFKFFWIDLGDFIYRSFLQSYKKGELSQSQKLGIISILPKGNKPREFLKNWRPISLLNVTYKILSGIIANRIKSILPKIIHENQKGFMAGRYIGENTRLLYDVIHICNEKNIPGLLLMVDFEKAFDSVSWKFIRNVLIFFNFGETIINWINIFFNNFKLCVTQNGFYSPFFPIGRGCRQGDPVSPYIFLMCVEIMGALFRKNKDIRGIHIMNKEYKILQYADDTAILLDGTENSLNHALSLIDQFSKFSGLKPNYQKTSCIKIGSLRNSGDILCKNYKLTWSQDPFIFLGITFTVDLKNIIERNFEEKIIDLEKLIKSWSRRLLSTAGKITVVKTILLPKLTHLFISLPNPPEKKIKEIESIFFKFIWKSGIDKIARKTLMQDYSDGGLRMICVRTFINSLKTTWIRRIMNAEDNSWVRLLQDTLPLHFKHYYNFGNNYFKQLASDTTNMFWKDVFNAVQCFKYITDADDLFIFNALWFNDKIKINGKVIYYKQWFDKGVRYVYDLVDENGSILCYADFCMKFNFYPAFTLYYGIIQCIRCKIDMIDMNRLISDLPYRPKFIEILVKDKKGSRHIYDLFVKKCYLKPKSEEKWESELDFNPNKKWWVKHNNMVRTLSTDISLRWFQYRIIHRILGTNSFLYKIRVIDSNLCTFCNEQPETILHLFWSCPKSSQIWEDIRVWIKNELDIDIDFNCIDIIFGLSLETYSSINLIICIVKRYLYKQKMNKCIPNIIEAKKYIKYYMKLDEHIYKKNLNYDAFLKKWKQFAQLLHE